MGSSSYSVVIDKEPVKFFCNGGGRLRISPREERTLEPEIKDLKLLETITELGH